MYLVFVIFLLALGLGYLIGHLMCKLLEIENEKTSISILSSAVCLLSLLIGFRLGFGINNFLHRSFSGTIISDYGADIFLLLFPLFFTIVFSFCTAFIVKKLYKKK